MNEMCIFFLFFLFLQGEEEFSFRSPPKYMAETGTQVT